jgi:hypothetical protein
MVYGCEVHELMDLICKMHPFSGAVSGKDWCSLTRGFIGALDPDQCMGKLWTIDERRLREWLREFCLSDKCLCTIIFIFPGAASTTFGANAKPPVRKI